MPILLLLPTMQNKLQMDILEKKQNLLCNELQELLPKAETLLDAIRDRKDYLVNVGYDICEDLAIDIAGKIAHLNYIFNDRMPEHFWQQRKND